MAGTEEETVSQEIERLKHEALLEAAMSEEEFQSSQTLADTSFTIPLVEDGEELSSLPLPEDEVVSEDGDFNLIQLIESPPPETPEPPPRHRSPAPTRQVNQRERDQETQHQHARKRGKFRRRMSSFDSDKAGSTQPYSQYVDDSTDLPKSTESKSLETEARTAEHRAAQAGSSENTSTDINGERTYTTDSTGHVQLTTSSRPSLVKKVTIVEEEEEIEDEAQLVEEEFNIEAQTAILASQFPDDRRFKTPKTPASRDSRGLKRARNGRILSTPGSAPGTTPRLPVNPFGGGVPGNPAVMSLSQAFSATQAQSSPIPNAPNSDAASERPSPHLGDVGRPYTAPASSPTRLLDTPLLRSEPYTKYTPLRASQEERERKDNSSSPPVDEADAFSDDDFSASDSPVATRASKRMSATTRQKLAGITAEVRSPNSKRGGGRGGSTGSRARPKANAGPHSSPRDRSEPIPSASRPRTPGVVRDDDEQNGDPILQKAEGSNGLDETGVNGGRSVQVPRTIGKRRQIMNMTEQSPASSRRGDSNKATAQFKSVEVLSSQSAQRNERRANAQRSSQTNDAMVVQSQVPDSTGVAQPDIHSALPRVRALAPSQQTATPPSSSPSPQRRVQTQKRGRNAAVSRPVSQPKQSAGVEVVPEVDLEDDLTSPGIQIDGSPELPTTLQESNMAEEHPDVLEPEMQLPSTPASAKTSPGTKRKLQRPKKFGQILTKQSPAGPSTSFDDIDISAFTADDEDFQRRLGQDHEASPEKPARRRRAALGRARYVPDTNSAGQESSFVGAQVEVEPPSVHATKLSPEVPVTRNRAPATPTPERPVSQKENEPTPRRKRRAPEPAPDVDATTGTTPQKPPASTISEPVVSASRKRPRTESSRQQQRMELEQPSTDGGTRRPESPLRLPMGDDEPEPTMVWALFNGTQQKGYYPARCLGQENNRFRVRFDDGNEAMVPCSAVRKLELREGDVVKVDGKDTKTNVYVVRGMVDKQLCGPPATQMQTFSDVHGWTKVKLGIKGSDDVAAAEDELVSVTMLYLTQTLFNGLKDRVYVHPTDMSSIRPQTPSMSGSVPPTPLSKQRRLKASIKKESMLRQSYRASANHDGLFSGMAFSVTSVDQKKRQQLEIEIEDSGGTLLVDGFRGLFHMPEKSQLQSSNGAESTSFAAKDLASTYGFSALLTERHCRTTAYLHALALNIPCISICWVKDCLAKDELLDWRPYLLASGESLLLDGAVRSRVMETPPQFSSSTSAVHWPLHSMLAARTQPMAGAKIVLVTNSAVEKLMEAHLFIAYALGASRVALAQGWKKAEAYMKDGKHGWDWICCPDEAELGASQKGRKRKSGVLDWASEMEIRRQEGARIVKPEFVVQSLVLQRLVSQ